MKSFLVGVISVFLIVLMVGGFISYHFVTTQPSDNPEEVVFEVPQGKTFQKVAKELEDARLVQNANLFSWYARFKGQANKMKVGEYSLRRNMSPSEVLAVIVSGKSIGHAFTVAEGLNMFEIADLYESEGYGRHEDFLKLCLDKELIKTLLGEPHDSLEGYLYPETYQLTKYTSTKELVVSMVHKFLEVYAEIAPRNHLQNFTRHQVITLASIIEKETGAPEERPLISSIFHNRLQKGMMLQTDPTIIYGMAEASGKTVYKIGKQDILRPTKYNTYVIKGLPPGPIANPGRDAMLAAIEPAQSKYFFFVSQNNGTHIFSETYEAHNKAVQKFQLDPKAREGKSWRDLQKRKLPAGADKAGAAKPAATVTK